MFLSRVLKPLARFRPDERGEVTIGWLAITAGIIGMSVVLLSQIGGGTQELSGKIDDDMTTREISTTF